MRRVAVLAAALLALTACTSDARNPDEPPRTESTLTACPDQPDRPAAGGELLPDLDLDCPGGGSLDLGRAPGVPTVVNLWGSWCIPCRKELPILQDFAQGAGDAVRVVGVISQDGLPQAESFAHDAEVFFPNAFDGEGDLMIELGLNALPITYFLDAAGGVAHVQRKPFTSVDELRALTAQHLGVQL
ncbi:TlpA family protein disulfide reductase [Candidatus Blastococcus massiliensis]|uniref:TlpA family protein disulfide reductase n=1 Tax=Candidatus Blastococcus massiliensis TaxID=1470358 RepID=UPI00058BC589|nr:TlpA disulfide reductase family protein [Candidatus Blastococcus massiliensis]